MTDRVALLPASLAPLDVDGVELHWYDDALDASVAGLSVDTASLDAGVLARVGFLVPLYRGGARGFDIVPSLPALEVVQLLTAGYDHAAALTPDGVALCNAAGVHDASTSELAVGLILASLRGLDAAVRQMTDETWLPQRRPALADRRVVVVGAGGVGRATAARLAPFETDVAVVGRTARDGVHGVDELPALLSTADVVVLAVPLNDTTRGMVDAAFLRLLPDGALVVNVSRGPVVDTDALLAELRSGRLRAALDVTDPEPLPAGHPLWSAPGVLITPHLGGNTSAYLPRARRLVQSQLHRWATGERMAHIVN